MFAALASLGRVHRRVTWLIAAGVGAFVTTVVLWGDLVRISHEPLLWVHLAYWTLFPLAGAFLCLLTAAACGRSSAAVVGSIYTTPWTILMIAGYARDSQSGVVVATMFAIWLCAIFAIIAMARVTRTPQRLLESPRV